MAGAAHWHLETWTTRLLCVVFLGLATGVWKTWTESPLQNTVHAPTTAAAEEDDDEPEDEDEQEGNQRAREARSQEEAAARALPAAAAKAAASSSSARSSTEGPETTEDRAVSREPEDLATLRAKCKNSLYVAAAILARTEQKALCKVIYHEAHEWRG